VDRAFSRTGGPHLLERKAGAVLDNAAINSCA
jgi:hypothetical protein